MNSKVDFEPLSQHSTFKDKKRKLWLLGIVIPNIANVAFLGYQFGPKSTQKLFAMTGPLALHVVIPAIDKLLGEDPDNPPESVISELEADPYYANMVKLFIPFQLAANVYGQYLASRASTPLLDKILFGHLLGVVNGVAVNTAHELSHKSAKLEHYLSHLCLAPTGYNHFRIEHPYGHHRRVATPEDPASSQLGESFWQFWPRTVIGSFKSAIEIETRRLERKGKSFWSLQNELLQGWGISLVYHGLMLKMFGRGILPTQLTQAFCGITLFETVNYMEHYGLKRQDLGNGKYARTMPEHSWNNNSLFSNVLLYQLQRHSDHHAYPTRSFQSLRHYENVPQLPAGYASMVLPALIPKWWFKLMDERVIQHYEGDIEKLNVYPKARNRIQKLYAHLFKTKQMPQDEVNA
ncbi:alkane 1-monooxygenase [Acinetobacter baylyi]|uniref:alkane 1-monooxygenase n=1 Tax=Acinetobacter baylyi TaxID=202950 RepID=UPI000EA3C727|nr:alkane 1-monooxygenase [Acinetobacter baylyi]